MMMFSLGTVALSQIPSLLKKSNGTVKILLETRAFIRIITFHRDGGGQLLEATSARKIINMLLFQFLGKGRHLEKAASVVKSVEYSDTING